MRTSKRQFWVAYTSMPHLSSLQTGDSWGRFVCMACQEDLVQLHLALQPREQDVGGDLSLMLSANHMPNLARCADHMPNLASASGASSAFAAMGPTAQGIAALGSVDTNSISTFELRLAP